MCSHFHMEVIRTLGEASPLAGVCVFHLLQSPHFPIVSLHMKSVLIANYHHACADVF